MTSQNRRRASAGVALVVSGAAAALGLTVLIAAGSAASSVSPANTTPPTIAGTASEGSVLTASKGSWTGTEPITYTYEWRRCDKDGGSCSRIGGATDNTYTLKSVDIDNTLRVRVTATNSGGSSSATSVPTAVVRATPRPAPTGCPSGTATVQVADVSPPARLIIDRFQPEPSVVHRGTQALVVHVHVSDTCGQPVQGALVYTTGVPYNQLSIPQEQATDATGTVNLTFQTLAGFPAARQQQLLVLFVRARKSGDNVLAGISTRRLVSVPVDLRS